MWDRNRPKHLPLVDPESKRPGFGYVGFTTTKRHQSVAHAVNYATKFCIKYPNDGFPDWVLDYEGRIDRYQASQGFWSSIRERDCVEPENELDKHHCTIMTGDCDCPKCRGDEPKRNYRRTIPKRMISDQGTVSITDFEQIQIGVNVEVMVREQSSDLVHLEVDLRLNDIVELIAGESPRTTGEELLL